MFFIGKYVAQALGYSNTRKALLDHVDQEDKVDGVMIRDSIGRDQKAVFINESGLYSLILSSKLPQAKAFKRWVTSEVLPQIRKTGGYIPTRDEKGKELSPEEVLARAHQIVGRTLRLLNGPNCDCLTATQVAESWGMDVHSFNSLLRRMGIQYKQGGDVIYAEAIQEKADKLIEAQVQNDMQNKTAFVRLVSRVRDYTDQNGVVHYSSEMRLTDWELL